MTRRSLLITAVLGFGILLASGCYLEIDDGFDPSGSFEIEVDDAPLAWTDLQVDWTVDHSDAAALCSIYGVQQWQVWVYGAVSGVSRDAYFDCRTSWWSSEADFYDLPVGTYYVTVSALDDSDMTLSMVSRSISAYDAFETLTINFDGTSL